MLLVGALDHHPLLESCAGADQGHDSVGQGKSHDSAHGGEHGGLGHELQDVIDDFNKLAQKDLPAINAGLRKKKQEAITVLAEADWEKKKEESSAAAGAGMRSPSDPASIHRVKRILGETPRRGRGTWSRLALEYGSKINSGDIAAITEVVRDLYRPGVDSGQSFSERQLYETALDRLSEEMALVDGTSKEQSVENVVGLLKAGKLKRIA